MKNGFSECKWIGLDWIGWHADGLEWIEWTDCWKLLAVCCKPQGLQERLRFPVAKLEVRRLYEGLRCFAPSSIDASALLKSMVSSSSPSAATDIAALCTFKRQIKPLTSHAQTMAQQLLRTGERTEAAAADLTMAARLDAEAEGLAERPADAAAAMDGAAALRSCDDRCWAIMAALSPTLPLSWLKFSV